jgi:hypothetical protein
MNIPIQQARGLFTQALVDTWRERVVPTNFLRSFFVENTNDTRYVDIEVRRGRERIASDVLRGTEGNRNQVSRSTQKVFEPPYYREYLNVTEIDLYDRVFGEEATSVSDNMLTRVIDKVAEDVLDMQDKIERAHELQCAQVLQTGIVLLQNAVDIDYKRKAASLVDLTAPNYWDQATSTPLQDFEAGGNFLRSDGKIQTGVYNAVMRGPVLNALLDNAQFKARADLRRVSLVDITMPSDRVLGVGSVLHGEISAGSYKIRLWTYDEEYELKDGTKVKYIDGNKVILLPEAPRFKFEYGAVPKIVRDTGNAEFPEFIGQVAAKFSLGNWIDRRADAHYFDVKSAGLAVPVGVDHVYTMQVLA